MADSNSEHVSDPSMGSGDIFAVLRNTEKIGKMRQKFGVPGFIPANNFDDLTQYASSLSDFGVVRI